MHLINLKFLFDKQVGQRVLEVNENSLLGITHEEAVNIMRSAGSTIRLVVCDGYDYHLVSAVVTITFFKLFLSSL